MNLNQVQLIGRVGQDPETKQLPSGALVCNFSLATNRTWKDKDGKKQEATEWHNIVFFGDNLIEKVIEPYVKKGSEVFVRGRLQTRSWEKDEVKHYRTEVVGEELSLGSRPKGDDNDEGGGRSSTRRPVPPRRMPKSLEEQEAAQRVAEEFPEEEGEGHRPDRTVQRKVAGKGRTVKSTSGDEINPDDIPF